MKKTLTLLALLMIAGPQAMADTTAPREVWWNGVTHDPETQMLDGAITTYKYNPYGGADSEMCWVASACNVIAWWQDRVEENGALIVPEGTPRDYKIFDVERTLWNNVGGYQGNAIQMWMTGGSKLNLSKFDAPQAGLDFAGYYPRLAGACLGMYNYSNAKGVNPETAAQYPNDYSHYEYSMIQTQWYRPSNKSFTNPDLDNYERASKQIVDYMENEWGVVWTTTLHAMTAYGVELDEDGLITKLYNSDNNSRTLPDGKYTVLNVWSEDNGDGTVKAETSWGGGFKIDAVVAVRTTGIRFLDYDVRVGKNLVNDNELLFSHYCNLIVDGEDDYKLQYDLRDASVDGSPVDAKKVEQYTVDEGFGLVSYHERYTDEVVTTGDLLLRGGQVTLVNCAEERVELDGGGKVAGVIRFQDSVVKGTTNTIQEADRTLKVDRTDTIAKEINLSATKGTNTLEVTGSNTATFGKLTGEGNLDKTGTGTAKVTDAVELQGEIRVKEGDFIFGKNVVLTGNTRLTVSDGAHVQSAEGQDITLTITSGVQVNDGVLALTTTVKTGATLKGSGTFAAVTVDGGTLIVGNSPGHQDYEGALTLNSGKLVFCVSGFEEASAGDNTGWDSDTYSTINMRGNELVVNENGEIVIALSADAANSLTTANGTVELTLATGLQSGAFSEEQLAALAEQTSFELSVEEGAGSGTKGLSTLNAPKFSYKMVDDALVLTTGVSGGSPAVPEPATGTLSLLALAGLCARRRRK